MKKSELVQMIREEISKIRNEAVSIPFTRQPGTMAPKKLFRKGQAGGWMSDPDVDSAESAAHGEDAARAKDVKVKNPATGKEILAMTAYKAGSKHPAYNAAKSALKKEIVSLRHK